VWLTWSLHQVFLQGALDNKGSLTSRLNYRWHDKFLTKTQLMLASDAAMQEDMAQDMVQIENEYVGDDFTASIKMVNPSALNGGLTGIFMGSYLQSVTSRLGLGFETIWQRTGSNQPPDTGVSVCARYKADDWIATTQLQSHGALTATYWRRLTENCQAGVDMQLAMLPAQMSPMGPVGPRKEGQTTAGIKYDFKSSSLRSQVDSKGKISVLVEKRIGQALMMTFATELDHSSVRLFMQFEH
jgi:mitochondrial import receptor subunit TOM40